MKLQSEISEQWYWRDKLKGFQRMILKYILTTVCATAILIGCMSRPQASPALSSLTDSPTATQAKINASFITAGSFKELADRSDLVVIGQLSEVQGIVNMARQIDDVTKPDPNLFGVGQIYEFTVIDTINGEAVSSIQLLQPEGMIFDGDFPPSSEKIEDARSRYPYIPPRVGVSYLLFLSQHSGHPGDQYYVGNVHPTRFDASDPDQVRPESPWYAADTFFPPIPLAEILTEISVSQ